MNGGDDSGNTSDKQGTRGMEKPKYRSLHWSANPLDSFSDWTIEVAVGVATCPSSLNGSGQVQNETQKVKPESTQKYHVHKVMLAHGTKECLYFRRLFQSPFAESKTGTSRIELEESQAQAFPVLLDYLYSTENKVALTTDNVLVLYTLADSFECQSLQWETMHFLEKDLSIANCHVYFERAQLLCIEGIQQAVVDLCSKNISSIRPDSPFLRVVDVWSWLEILERSRTVDSEHKNLLVAAYCRTRSVDALMFHQLTDKRLLPTIAYDAVQHLLECEALVRKTGRTDKSKSCLGTSREQNGEATSKAVLLESALYDEPNRTAVVSSTCLQERCAKVLISHWEKIDEQHAILSHFSPGMRAKIAFGALEAAKGRLKNYEPKEIVVSGVTPDIDGVYVRRGENSHGAHYMQFVKRLQGDSAVIRMERQARPRRSPQWVIAHVTTSDGVTTNRSLYRADVSKANPLLPPQAGWKSWSGSEVPTLQLDYVFEESS